MPVKERSYMVQDSLNLYLRVYSSGKKKWIYRGRIDGKERQMTLGIWPVMGILEARRARDARQLNIESGGTGTLATFRKMAEDWIKQQRQGKVSDSVMYYTNLRLSYVPSLLDRPVSLITRPEVIAALRAVSDQKSPETARRTAMVVKMVMDYCTDMGEIPAPHCALDLSRTLSPQRSENYPSIHAPALIGVLLRALDRITGFYVRSALQMTAYTFVRSGELREARWKEIDFNAALWNIPAAHTKMKRDHVVPLARQTVKLLKEIALRGDSSPDALIFPSSRGGRMGRSSMISALYTLQKLPIDVRPAQMSVHGFRSMASTILNENGWNGDAVERQLAHWEQSSVRSAYNKAQYLDIRIPMMDYSQASGHEM